MFKDSTEDFVGVPVSKFPHEARKYLSAFDRNGDGMIDLGELEHAARTIEEARRGNLTVDMFPERLRATVRALDDEGDGVLEIDEIAEMVEMYAALKEANKNGEISIATLPKEIQPTLKVFDVDGDGTVAPSCTSSPRRRSRSSPGSRLRSSCSWASCSRRSRGSSSPSSSSQRRRQSQPMA